MSYAFTNLIIKVIERVNNSHRVKNNHPVISQNKNCNLPNMKREIFFQEKVFHMSTGDDENNMNYAIPLDGIYEPWVTKYFELASIFYGEDKDAVDIGANIGIMTLILSTLQSKATVIAFEPMPLMFDQLEKNIKENQAQNIIAQQFILSNTDETPLYIHTPTGNSIGSAFTSNEAKSTFSDQSRKITGVKLDSYIESYQEALNIKIIKIDAECWEKHILQGAQKTIGQYNPVVFIEFNVEFRSIDVEQKGHALFSEILSTFNFIFLIDRITHSLFQIKSYADLRAAMLTGHFVEDLICFNDANFFNYLKDHIIACNYTTYFAAKLTLAQRGRGVITSMSHYPDNWCHGHDFVLFTQSSGPLIIQLTFENIGPYETNHILVTKGNEITDVVLEREPVSQIHNLDSEGYTFIYIFVEKIFKASEFFNNNDPRQLGVIVKVNELEPR